MIENVDFSTLVGVANEPNMCSGGTATIRRVLQQVPVHADSRFLEVGSNTGFTTIEFASWIPGKVYGVDINPKSIELARKKASAFGITNAEFIHANALTLPFENHRFDLVFVSNVTSFIQDRERAITEYYRVLKPRGVLAAVPIYYHEAPPEELRKRVEEAVGAPIPVRGKDYWQNLFSHTGTELFFDEEYEYIYQSPERIAAYVDMVMSHPHLGEFPAETRAAIANRLQYFYHLFNENLRYARYTILLYRTGAPNLEPILHQSRRVRAF